MTEIDASIRSAMRVHVLALREVLNGLEFPPGMEWPEIAESVLDAEEYEVLIRSLRGQTQAEICTALGLPRTRIIRIKNRAVRKLRYAASRSVWLHESIDLGDEAASPPAPDVDPEPDSFELDSLELELPLRVVNVLAYEGLWTIEDLMQFTRRDLLRLPGLGPMGLRRIEEGLEKMGLSLAP